MNPELNNTKAVQEAQANSAAIASAVDARLAAGQTVNLAGVTKASQVPINTTATQAPISTSTLSNPPTPYKIPDSQPSPYPTVQSVYDSVYTEQPTAAEQESAKQRARLTSLVTEQGNKAQDQLNAEAAAGVPGFQKTVNDLTSQINALNNEAQAQQLSVQDQPILGSIVAGQTQAIERNRAIKALTISSALTAAQGNLALAQQQADRAIEVKYAPIEAELKYFSNFIALNKDQLDREDKKKASQLEARLKERQEKVDEQKRIDVAIQNVMLEAAKTGADAVTLNKIQAATTVEDAVAASGTFLGADFRQKVAQQQFENKIALENLSIAKQKLALDKTKAVGITDPSTLLAYAQQYASTGVIPTGMPEGSFGLVSATAKDLPKSNGQVVDKSTNVKSSKIPAAEQDDFARLSNIVSLTDQLKKLDSIRSKGLVGGVLGKVTGLDSQQNEYLTIRQAIVDEVARMQTGAALTKEEQAFYESYLPGRFSNSFGLGQGSQSKIDNFAKIMKNKLNTGLNANNLALYGYSKVNVGGRDYVVGDTITVNGKTGRINADGSITVIN